MNSCYTIGLPKEGDLGSSEGFFLIIKERERERGREREREDTCIETAASQPKTALGWGAGGALASPFNFVARREEG